MRLLLGVIRNVQQQVVVAGKSSCKRWLPLLFFTLALADLQQEFRLLLDHFTTTSLLYAIRHHLLAVVVMISLPSLWHRYGLVASRHL